VGRSEGFKWYWLLDSPCKGCDAAWMKINFAFLCSTLLFVGCASTRQTVELRPVATNEIGIDVHVDTQIVDPLTGDTIEWSDLMDRIADVDVVLLGELHDHVVGHAVQLAVVEDVMDAYPESVLALEMLERDEQLRIDDYMDDILTAKTFARVTQSTDWAGPGSWAAWYQPTIDAAKERGGRVIAANSPRQYVKFGRTSTDWYNLIDELPKERRIFVDYPKELSSGRYRQRFWELAFHGSNDEEGEEEKEPIDVTEIDPDDPMLPSFKSQQIWDATMAQSVAATNPTVEHKTILLVGQFHVEYDGGIVQELRRRIPSAKVLVISIQREIPDEGWQDTPPIADLMVVGDIEEEYVAIEETEE